MHWMKASFKNVLMASCTERNCILALYLMVAPKMSRWVSAKLFIIWMSEFSCSSSESQIIFNFWRSYIPWSSGLEVLLHNFTSCSSVAGLDKCPEFNSFIAKTFVVLTKSKKENVMLVLLFQCLFRYYFPSENLSLIKIPIEIQHVYKASLHYKQNWMRDNSRAKEFYNLVILWIL